VINLLKDILRTVYTFYMILTKEYYFDLYQYIIDVFGFIKEYRIFLEDKNPKFKISINYIYPCLKDKTEKTLVEPTYFFQDTWAAKKIFEAKPKHHYDIGSAVKTVGIVSQFVPTTMVDIRPVDVSLDNLFFVKGSILNLPFKDDSVESLSSLCVVEHIGLGRYGDNIDSRGSEKAIEELKRVLKNGGGNLYFSVPIDCECRVYFNAHRAFTRSYILELFKNLELIEEKYIHGKKVYNKYNKAKGFGTGLFHFCKK